MWSTIVWFAMGLFFLAYVVGPIIIKYKHRQTIPDMVKIISLEDVPAEARPYIEDINSELRDIGFPAGLIAEITGFVPNVSAVAVFYLKHDTQDAAVVASLFQHVGDKMKLGLQYLEFADDFESGYEINTMNAKQLLPWPHLPGKSLFIFPEVKKAGDLFRIHSALSKREMHRLGDGSPKKAPPTVDRTPHRFRESVIKELNAKAAQGVFSVDRATGVYRPTWYGAFTMTWGLLWPVTTIRRHLAKRRRRRLLEAINFV